MLAPFTCNAARKMSVWCNEVVKLVLFVIKLLLEKAGRPFEFSFKDMSKCKSHSWLKFFSSYCMGEKESQFVIKKAIFTCPLF